MESIFELLVSIFGVLSIIVLNVLVRYLRRVKQKLVEKAKKLEGEESQERNDENENH